MSQRIALLVVAELVVFARHTVTQLLMSVGWTERDWSSWYRLFSRGRFPYEGVCDVLFGETLKHVPAQAVYVVAGDGTKTRRSSRKMEGAHWLHTPLSPVFKRGIHLAQRWFNGSWLLPAEKGYSRAMPSVGCLPLRRSHDRERRRRARNGKQLTPFSCGSDGSWPPMVGPPNKC